MVIKSPPLTYMDMHMHVYTYNYAQPQDIQVAMMTVLLSVPLHTSYLMPVVRLGLCLPWTVVLCKILSPTCSRGSWDSGAASWPTAKLSDMMKSPGCHYIRGCGKRVSSYHTKQGINNWHIAGTSYHLVIPKHFQNTYVHAVMYLLS